MNVVLEKLKQLPTIVNLQPQENYTFSLFPPGIPKVGLVELSGTIGTGKTEVLLKFLHEHPGLSLAWIEKDFTIFPPAFITHQSDLERVLFLDLSSPTIKHTPYWFASNIIKSSLFRIIILSHIQLDEIDLRRLQLLSKKCGILIIIVQNHSISNWCYCLQIHVTRSDKGNNFFLTPIKNKRLYQ